MARLPKSIIKKYGITKKAWKVFRGRKSRSRPAKVKTSKTRSVKNMGKKKRRGSKGMTIPLAPLLGLCAGLAAPIQAAIAGNYVGALNQASENFTGYSISNQNWDWTRLQRGLMPVVAGLLVHKFVGGKPLNLNRTLASAGVPFVRI